MTDLKEAVTSSGAHHNSLHTPLVVSVLDCSRWHRRDRHSCDEEGVRNDHDRRDIHHEVGRDRVEDRGVRHEEESGSAHEGSRGRHEVEAIDDDNRHGVDYNHGEGAHPDVRGNHHPGEDSHHGVEASENDRNARTKVLPPGAKQVVRSGAVSILWVKRAHTSDRQRTLEPLNSELSSLSTATLRSAAVSNSTKLQDVS